MACDGNDYITNFRDGTLYLIDGAGTTLTVPLDAGDISITGMNGDMAERTVYRTRGRMRTVRKTNDLEAQIAFSAMLNRLSSVTKDSVLDFVRFKGKYEHNTRTTGICGDVKTVHAKWVISTPDGDEYAYVPDVAFDFDISEGDPSQISMTGTCYNPEDIDLKGAT